MSGGLCRLKWLLVSMTCSFQILDAQLESPNLSFYNEAFLNPSLSGLSKENLSISFIERLSMMSIRGYPIISYLLVEKKYKGVGLGAFASYARVSSLSNISMEGDVAYKFTIQGVNKIYIGSRIGVKYISNNLNELNVVEEEPLFQETQSQFFFTAGLGMYLQTPSLGIGFSGLGLSSYFFNDEQIIFINEPIFNLNISYKTSISKQFEISPVYRMRFTANVISNDFGVKLSYTDRYGFGLFYNPLGSVYVVLSYALNESFFLGYSFQTYVSGPFSAISSGSQEVIISYSPPKPQKYGSSIIIW